MKCFLLHFIEVITHSWKGIYILDTELLYVSFEIPFLYNHPCLYNVKYQQVSLE